MFLRRLCHLMFLLAGFVPAVTAAEIGDEAPEISIQQWITGQPVSLKEGRGTNVYVVEFWATWCPPCRVSIPLLTDLQKKYKDRNLVIIGISNETEPEVRPFVAQMGPQMDYRVALDKDQATRDRYMVAFGLETIPTAFVVDTQGKIAWVGSPLRGMSNAVEQVLSGKFDLAQSKRDFARSKRETSLMVNLQRYMLVCAQGSREMAQENGRQILESIKDDATLTLSFVFAILTDGRFRFRDLKLARDGAEAVVAMTGRKDIAALEALAMATYELGDRDRGIALIKEAIDKTTEVREREILKQNLNFFEKNNAALK